MPPVAYFGKSNGTLVGSTITFSIPPRAQPGDQLVALVATDVGVPSLAIGDWMAVPLAFAFGTTAQLWVARRIVKEGDAPTVSLVAGAVPVWQLSVMQLYRQLDATAAIIASGGANVAAAANWPCPALALTAQSDLYVGAVVVTSSGIVADPPAGAVWREKNMISAGKGLSTFDVYRESVGSTGVQTATTGTPQSGLAGSIALAASPTPPAPVVKPDVPGAIGFVDIGV